MFINLLCPPQNFIIQLRALAYESGCVAKDKILKPMYWFYTFSCHLSVFFSSMDFFKSAHYHFINRGCLFFVNNVILMMLGEVEIIYQTMIELNISIYKYSFI